MLSGDLRLAWRRLVRNPGFTAAAVVTLALGIGANTAVFTLVDAALLRPLPFPEPDRLAVLWESKPEAGKDRDRVSAANYLDWRRESRTFSELTAWVVWGLALTGSGEPEELTVVRASSNLFRLAGVNPLLGRGFTADEETPGRDRVVVLSHAFWAGRFGAHPEVLGRTLTLDGAPHEIVGVMPPGFRFPNDGDVALWTPLAFTQSELLTRNQRLFNVIGRLAPHVGLPEARAELATITGRLAAAHPETNRGWKAAVLSAAQEAGAETRRPLMLLLGAVGFVLLIACANVGHLFLVRAIDRERELALRVALGAKPGRLVRLLLVESALVAALGAVLGLAVAGWSLPLARALGPGLVPGWREPAVDGPVLVVGAGLVVLVTLACGLAPALRASLRPPAVRSDAGGLRRGIIVAEVALSLVLLAGAGLLLRSLDRLQRVDPGFDAEHVLSATIFLSGEKYREDASQSAFFSTLVTNLRDVPGVEAVGAVTTLPMNPVGIDYDLPFSADGREPEVKGDLEEVDFRVVEGDYFGVLGIPLLRGRSMDGRDRADAARVAVVNAALARRFFGGADPVGRQVWVGGRLRQVTIVGLVGDTRHRGLATLPRPELYVPSAQRPHGGMTVVARGTGDPAALTRALKDGVYALDRNQPISSIATLPDLVSSSVAPRRVQLLLLSGFAALALALAALGVYGVVAYTVGRRAREIGIRIALGATESTVRRTVLLPGLGLTAVGVLFGLLGAALVGRLLSAELYEVSPHDPQTLAGAAVILFGVAWAACEIPARRATRNDPVNVLRSE
jgi:putative ABC transport system permease protein